MAARENERHRGNVIVSPHSRPSSEFMFTILQKNNKKIERRKIVRRKRSVLYNMSKVSSSSPLSQLFGHLRPIIPPFITIIRIPYARINNPRILFNSCFHRSLLRSSSYASFTSNVHFHNRAFTALQFLLSSAYPL